MSDKTYNGWTNYETWNIKLWMDNDEGSQGYWLEQAQAAYDQAEADDTFTRDERAALDLMDTIKDEYENALQDVLKNAKMECSWMSDICGAALQEVNWHEIAASLVEGTEKEELETAE